MLRIAAASLAAITAVALSGCSSGDSEASDAGPADPSPAAVSDVTAQDATPADHGGPDEAFKVDPADVKIDKCGQVDPDIGTGGSDAVYVLVTNRAPMPRHFHVTVNTYGPDGVRGEAMYPNAYSVAPGETATAKGNLGGPAIAGLRCEVGQVLTIPSEGVPDGDWWWLREAS